MTTAPIEQPPVHVSGISLDAESIRAELTESPQSHDLTPATAQTLIEMSDDELNASLRAATDDTFWEIYDNTRRRAITFLIARLDDHAGAVPDPSGA